MSPLIICGANPWFNFYIFWEILYFWTWIDVYFSIIIWSYDPNKDATDRLSMICF